jgi:hypothetical protein
MRDRFNVRNDWEVSLSTIIVRRHEQRSGVVRKNTLAAKRAIVATLAKRKAENVDQSDSSIPFAAIPEDTPILVKFPPHYLTVQPQAAIFSSRYS